ncbi:MAG: hypothetical protein N4A53_02980 [Pelagimonas sp.]|jgi:Ca2+-binding RTX toxin-like protein|nr:hypothetical protein [Pelagimonas sp.]
MAHFDYALTLDGARRVVTPSGERLDWSSGWLGYVDLSPHGSTDTLNAQLALSGSDWSIGYLRVIAPDGAEAQISDLDAQTGRAITLLDLPSRATLDLQSTRVDHIRGSGDMSGGYDLQLAAQNIQSVTLFGGSARVANSGGFIGTVETGAGDDTVSALGDLGRVSLGAGADRAYLQGDWVAQLDMGAGHDRLVLRGSGGIGTVTMGSGNDRVVLRNSSDIGSLAFGSGSAEVELRQNTRVAQLSAEGADLDLTLFSTASMGNLTLSNSQASVLTTQGRIQSIDGWNSALDLQIGNGGVGQISLSSDQDMTQRITALGGIGQLQIEGAQATALDLQAAAGALRLGEGDDTLSASSAGAELISTRGGDDQITLAGCAGVLRSGAGNDTVETGDWVALLATGAGDDLVIAGAQGMGQIRLGEGDDVLRLQMFDRPDAQIQALGGLGTDLVDFSLFATGIDLELRDDGGFTRPLGEDTAQLSLTGFESVLGSTHEDRITGSGNRAEHIDGGDGHDTLDGAGGADTLLGGRGRDVIYVATGNDLVDGGSGADLIVDYGSDALILGGAGADTIEVGSGAPHIVAGAGDDLIDAGRLGTVTLEFGANAGRDRIRNFEEDLIRLTAHQGGFDSLHIVQVDTDLRIRHDGGTITLLDAADLVLSADDFLFA